MRNTLNEMTVEIITDSGGTFINKKEIAAIVRYEGAVDIHLRSGTIFTAKLLDNEVFDHDSLISELLE